jgi:hypothetical protein
MRFAGQDSRSNKFSIFLAADNRNNSFLDLEGYLRKLALRITWPSFGNTTVLIHGYLLPAASSNSIALLKYRNSQLLNAKPADVAADESC